MYEAAYSEQYDPAQWEQIRQMLDTVRISLEQQNRVTESANADVLRKRAKVFAALTPSTIVEVDESEDLVLFMLGNDTYGVSCNEIEEVIPLQNLVALPNTNKSILGISSLRGILFSVVDLKRVLNIPASELTTMHRVLMVRHESFKVGFLVDSVQGMRSFSKNEMQDLPSEIHERSRTYLHGLALGNVLILNARVILQDQLAPAEDRAAMKDSTE
ncbi:MAG: purine-binding chemotaxis protein CheW [Bacteroidetes bacterium]|nr:purine-binding chemotaxis protein CheW [Bacteroidota bacterium]